MCGPHPKACVVVALTLFCSFLAIASGVAPAFADQESGSAGEPLGAWEIADCYLYAVV